MYLITPLAVILASIVLILFLILRKFVYLKKLDPSAVQDAPANFQDFRREMFPEITLAWQRIGVRNHGMALLAETEKVLRKLRLFFLRIDTLIHGLIRKMRKKTEQQHAQVHEAQQPTEEESIPPVRNPHEEEQQLIMEIAKNPKEASLYKKLGIVYMNIGELNDARQSFEKALELDPDDVLVKNKLKRLTVQKPA